MIRLSYESVIIEGLFCHTNGSKESVYCDADILDETQSGIIYYEIKYNTHTAMASDFKEEFINHDTNQGQYFYDPKTELVSTNSNYIFNTNRLRCSYIEDKYLVLSANRSGVKEAYLEFEVENKIRALEFNMGLWSGKEITGRHAILSSETSKRYVLCCYCKYSLDLTKDVMMIIYV